MEGHGIEATIKDKGIWLLGSWQVKAEPVGQDVDTRWAGAAVLDASVSETYCLPNTDIKGIFFFLVSSTKGIILLVCVIFIPSHAVVLD